MVRNSYVGWLGTFLQLTIRSSWGVISVPIAIILHLNSLEIGLVATSFYLGYILTSVPWGITIDKIGPERVISYCSLFLSVINVGLFLYQGSYALILSAYLLEGLIASGIFPSAMKILAMRYQGASLTSAVGLLDGALPVTMLLLGSTASLILSSWRYVFLMLSVGFAIIYLLTVRGEARVQQVSPRKSITVFTDKKILFATLMRFGEMWATWGTITWIFPLLVLYRGIPTYLSGSFLLLFGLGQLLGIISVDRIARRLGDRNVILANLLGFMLLTFLMTLTGDPLVLLIEALPLGVVSFAFRPPTDALIMKLSGNGRAGTSIGFANSISQTATMIVPSFIGFVLLVTHDFTVSIMSLDIGCVISILSLFLLFANKGTEDSTYLVGEEKNSNKN